ncbi:hypothetical protein [Deinococcus cellulosilyticus]|uniref:Gp5/Type VI secretion system Vgr protein OB-fold domain-containing protein n=1 Tax=Deinococcus cellulosilyticus (strain DSM 18568 / NBRC 106333 / KACC 11606 / 5516J-15) TaxID=1223518 RepID=A0A511N762_DEIC1|nr:hypothetical protein [Deinococcus cellulosilyticus]GEM48683.1 hypothetical protein DC3_43180 [Deinococcus cellulosilyticus NBRC 106333 = KACC 11606]
MRSDLRGIHLAQVLDVHPEDYQVSVLLPHLARSEGIRVRLGGNRQHPVAGDFELPEKFDYGVVAFYANHPKCGIWLKSLSDEVRHIIPTELFKEDKHARVQHLPSDRTAIHFGDGSEEHRWPDGSFLTVMTRKDGTKSNTGLIRKLLDRFRTLGRMGQKPERKAFQGQRRPPVDVVFHHQSGAEVWITGDGSIQVQTARGHKIRMYDATEKARNPEDGSVQSTPDEDAQRVASELTIETEVGHKITLHDDPQEAEINRYVSVKTALGHEIRMKDKPDNDQFIQIKSNLGHEFFMRDKPDNNQFVRVKTALGHEFLMQDKPGNSQQVKVNSAAGHQVLLQDAPTKQLSLTSAAGHKFLIDDTTGTMILQAVTIVLKGIVKLGSEAAMRPVVGNNDVDSRGDATFATNATVFIQ